MVGADMLHIPRDSSLVRHLLTSWQAGWQLSRSLPHTYDQATVGLKWETYRANIQHCQNLIFNLLNFVEVL